MRPNGKKKAKNVWIHTKATMTPSTTVTGAGLKRSAPSFLHNDRHAMEEKTTRTFNITTKEKLSFGASNVSLKNRCHGVLLNKMLEVSVGVEHAVPNCR